jgi:hypothetical protein
MDITSELEAPDRLYVWLHLFLDDYYLICHSCVDKLQSLEQNSVNMTTRTGVGV